MKSSKFAAALVLLSSCVFAVTLPSLQQNLEITLMQRQDFALLLALENNRDVTEELNLTCSGSCSMITFGGEGSESYFVTIPPHSRILLPLRIRAGNEIGTYSAEIMANNRSIASVRIHVTLPPDEVLDLREQRELREEIEDVKDFVSVLLQELESEINRSVSAMNRSVSSRLLTALEHVNRSIKSVESRQEELEKSVSSISSTVSSISSPTGAATLSTSIIGGSFVLGAVITLLALHLSTNTTKIKALLSRIRRRRYEFKHTAPKEQPSS